MKAPLIYLLITSPLVILGWLSATLWTALEVGWYWGKDTAETWITKGAKAGLRSNPAASSGDRDAAPATPL